MVNKDIGEVAMTAVQGCEVHFGKGGASPDPSQVVKRMAKAQLRNLDIVITVTSGEEAYMGSRGRMGFVMGIVKKEGIDGNVG